ncbi:TetR/AcrR family transcriptional regulator [soil metagenome]
MTDPAPPLPARERGDAVRQALLAVAHDLLASEGPGALTVRRIATEAGMSTMNLYSRFGGKEGVVDELYIDGFRRLAASMSATVPDVDPLEDLRMCGEQYRRFAQENPTYYTLMFDAPIPDFEPSDAAKEVALGALDRVAQRVQRAIDAGLIAGVDAFHVATGLWACEHGLVSLEMKMSDADHPFDWDHVSPATVDALVRGLAACTPPAVDEPT